MFGCEYDGTEIEREREQRGSEVVLTVREYEECVRCGEIRLISENTGVTRAPREEGTPGEEGGDAGADAPDQSASAASASGDTGPVERNGDAADGPDDGGVPDPPIEEAEPDRTTAPAGVADAIEDAEDREIDALDGTLEETGSGDDPRADTESPDDDAVILDDSGSDPGASDGDPAPADPVVEGAAGADPAAGEPAIGESADGEPVAGEQADGDTTDEITDVEDAHDGIPDVSDPAVTASDVAAAIADDEGDDQGLPDDDAVILDDGDARADWPGTGMDGDPDPDPQWNADARDPDGERSTTDEAVAWHGTEADARADGETGEERPGNREHGEWPTRGDDSATPPDPAGAGAGAGDWPTTAATDEGWDATPTDGGDAPVEMTGLAPSASAGETDADGPTVTAERTAGTAEGSAGPAAPGATSATDGSAELFCAECRQGIPAGRTPLRQGDICPECATGYLTQRETRNR